MMNRKEREAYIERTTGYKIADREMNKSVLCYYNENGALIAKFNGLNGKLEIIIAK